MRMQIEPILAGPAVKYCQHYKDNLGAKNFIWEQICPVYEYPLRLYVWLHSQLLVPVVIIGIWDLLYTIH
jgi:hypothetical protein